MWWKKSPIALSDEIGFDDSLDIDTNDLDFLVTRRKYGSGLDIIGHKFNKWTVISRVDPSTITGHNRYNMFEVQCECGTSKRIASYALSSGSSTMCKRCSFKARKTNRVNFCR